MRGGATLRICAAAAIALLAAYELMRLAAQQCSGEACDAYIPLSLLFPVAILVLVAVTGGLAISAARPRDGAWRLILVAATALSVVGPLLLAVVFRDQPDALGPTAGVLFLLTPTAALVYSFRSSSPPSR